MTNDPARARGAEPLNIPRRAQMQEWTPAERAIYDACLAVEAMPADVRLTDAVVLLGAARNSVADFVDGIDRRRRVVEGEAARDPGPREPLVTLLDELRGALAAWDDKRYISAPLFLEERVWRAVRRLAESAPPRVSAPEQAEAAAILEAVQLVLNGESVSDFMESFPVVREVRDLVIERYLARATPHVSAPEE